MDGDHKLKVVTLVGTRPELIKLSRVVAALERFTDHCLVHSGQNYDYELNEIFFSELGLPRPKHFLEAVGDNAALTIAGVIAGFDAVLEVEHPDAVLVYGDTNTGLGVIAAKRRGVPVFHMEAGNRCFDPRVPEELNRRVIDHVSDLNMTNSVQARELLLREGLHPQSIVVTGSPMREVLDHHQSEIEASDVLERMSLESGQYFLVSSHREETVDHPDRLQDLVATLRAVADTFSMRVLVSTHPRTRQRLTDAGIDEVGGVVELLPPFGFFDYVRLQRSARCVLSDSGTLMEEAAILGFPAVMLRESHERPEGTDAGVLVFSGLKADRVLAAIEIMTAADRPTPHVPDYGDTDVSGKVVRIISSFVDHINRVVLRKGE